MNILVTGSDGFVGRNLVWNLKEIQDGKNRARPELNISEIYCYDKGTSTIEFEYACKRADFVFHLAGVNRPKEKSEYMEGNFKCSSLLLGTLKKYGNKCPIVFSSSVQASLTGRFEGSEYGKSKLAAEELFLRYAESTGVRVFIYRFPNLFGKWCRPNYNSVVATFCNAVANDLEYKVDNINTQLELLYIDDLINEMFDILEGKEHHCKFNGLKVEPSSTGNYCFVPVTHCVTLGEIVELLNRFKTMPSTFLIPEMPTDSFVKKLYSTYLSYLPKEKISYICHTNLDNRGSFTELIRTAHCGQVSINVVKPGMTRGQHWHNSKWEIFVVVSGHGLIRERKVGIDPKTGRPYPVIEFEVTGEQIKAVQILPGYTHNILNLSRTENLVTVMWANEPFDEDYPDTFFEPVETIEPADG